VPENQNSWYRMKIGVRLIHYARLRGTSTLLTHDLVMFGFLYYTTYL